jgi:RNA polymerase sigma-70 factor (ECF subfamily)
MTLEVSLVEESEQDFVRRASQGDPAAFNWLFRRYSQPLLKFLHGMTGHREQAEDLMQETISRGFLSLPKLRCDAKFSTWLFGIAKNVTREMQRRQAHNPGSASLDDPEVDTLLDPKANSEAGAQRHQLHSAIRAGINTLDRDLRTALGLRVFAEMKYDEIAEITGWSSAKVKIEIHRARLKMRKAMAPYI